MFGFKGRSPDVRRLGRDLSVTHVLEGSIRRAGNRVRVNAQLVETERGNHLWAKKFDKEMADIFSVQDDIVRNVVAELDVHLVSGEQARSWRASTKSSEAYDLFLRAAYNVVNPEGLKESGRLLDRALELDPDFVAAYCYKGSFCLLQARLCWVKDTAAAFREARRAFETALVLDGANADAHAGRAGILFVEKKFEEAERGYELALSLGPVMVATHLMCAAFYTWKKDELKALSLIRRAKELNPYPLSQVYAWEICCLRRLGRLEEALAVAEQALKLFPEGLDIVVKPANVCRLLHRRDELEQGIRKILEILPDFSTDRWVRATGIYDGEEADRYIAELREAGFP